MGILFPGPWQAPEEGSAHVLRVWAAGLSPHELAASPLVVATCSHCDDVVLALGPGRWAFVEATATAATPPARDAWLIRRLSSLAEVTAAMADHAAGAAARESSSRELG